MNPRIILAIIGAVATIVAAVPPLISALKPQPAEPPVIMQGNSNIYAPGGTVHAPTTIFNTYTAAWRDGVSTAQAALGASSASPAPASRTDRPGAATPPAPQAPSVTPRAPGASLQLPARPFQTDDALRANAPSDGQSRAAPIALATNGATRPGIDASASSAPRCTASEIRVALEKATKLPERTRRELTPDFALGPDLCNAMLDVVRRLTQGGSPAGARKLEADKPLDATAAKHERDAASADAAFQHDLTAAIGDEASALRKQLLEAAVLHEHGYHAARDLLVSTLRQGT